MYFQEIYIFLMIFFHLRKFRDWVSAASLAWSVFTGELKDSPESLKVTMELIVCRFIFFSEHGDKWERFGSQELLIESLLGCSMGTKLTPILPKELTASPQTREHVFPESSAQFVIMEAKARDYQCWLTLWEAGFWNCLSVKRWASCFRVTRVRRYWSLQLLSRVFHKAWKRKGTEGDPGG